MRRWEPRRRSRATSWQPDRWIWVRRESSQKIRAQIFGSLQMTVKYTRIKCADDTKAANYLMCSTECGGKVRNGIIDLCWRHVKHWWLKHVLFIVKRKLWSSTSGLKRRYLSVTLLMFVSDLNCQSLRPYQWAVSIHKLHIRVGTVNLDNTTKAGVMVPTLWGKRYCRHNTA